MEKTMNEERFKEICRIQQTTDDQYQIVSHLVRIVKEQEETLNYLKNKTDYLIGMVDKLMENERMRGDYGTWK